MYRKVRSIFLFLVVGFLACHMYLLYVCDLSLTPVQPSCSEAVHLVSYADGPEIFKKNQNFQAFSAINRGVDHIHMYRRKDLDADFYARNKLTLDQPRGAGWWLWKPYVILQTLKNIPENAVVIYLDTGFSLVGHVQPLVDAVKHQDIGIIVHDDLGTMVQSVVQPQTLKGMNCVDAGCLTAPHIWAGIMVIKNTPHARAFIQKWVESCEKPDWLIQNPQQIQHNADEAILSVLCHQDSSNKQSISLRELNKMRVVKWHHRHPHQSYKSLLPFISGKVKLWLKYTYWMWRTPLERFS